MPSWSYPVLRDGDGRPLIVAVRDGDTFRAVLDAGAECAVFPWLRIEGVSCPELHEPGGPEATAFTASVLGAAGHVDVTLNGRSFARWVATVTVDGADLAQTIIDAGHGVIYEE